jgi:hypothetical protein
MKKRLTKIPTVSEAQVACGRKLGLELASATVGVALAKIEDWLDQYFWGKDLGRPTQKQIALAQQFDYDIASETRRVGSAIIGDIMTQLNLESIEWQHLEPGAVVTNKWEQPGSTYTISSIEEDGLVFFKGGNGEKAWARNLIKEPAPEPPRRRCLLAGRSGASRSAPRSKIVRIQFGDRFGPRTDTIVVHP